jgi:cation-transporting ATPase 13A2
MVGEYAHVYMPTFTQGSQSEPRSTIEWTDVEVDSLKLDPYSLKVRWQICLIRVCCWLSAHMALVQPIVPVDDDGTSFSSYSLDLRDYHLAVSGDVFRWMMDFGPLETVQRVRVLRGRRPRDLDSDALQL